MACALFVRVFFASCVQASQCFPSKRGGQAVAAEDTAIGIRTPQNQHTHNNQQPNKQIAILMASLAEKNEQAAEQTFAEGGELHQNKASLEYCLAKNVSLRGQPLQAKSATRERYEDLLCPKLQLSNHTTEYWREMSDTDKDEANYHNFKTQHDPHFITVEKRTTPGVKLATNATYDPRRDYATSGLDAMGNKMFAKALWKGFWRGANGEKLQEDPNKAKKEAAEAERRKRYEAEQAEGEAREAAERAEEEEREAAEAAEEEAREAAERAEEEAREAAEAAEEAAEEAREAAEEAAEEAREAAEEAAEEAREAAEEAAEEAREAAELAAEEEGSEDPMAAMRAQAMAGAAMGAAAAAQAVLAQGGTNEEAAAASAKIMAQITAAMAGMG